VLSNHVLQAHTILQHGGVIAYSTETVLGLGCDPYTQEAVNRILWLKNRAVENGLIVLVDSIDALQQYSQALTQEQITKIMTTENTSWLLPAKDTVPSWITGAHDKVAVRITDHPIAGPLSRATEGIVSTSANISSYKTLASQGEIRDWFGPHVDYMLIGDAGTDRPSQIYDLLTGEKLR
jgi:L-threonylcarbamoyladenylate synthase